MSSTIAETAERASLAPPAAHPALETVNDRVNYIADLMVADKWHPRRTKRELAPIWDVSESTVQNYSAEAGRWLKDGIRELSPAKAFLAMQRLEKGAVEFARSGIPGDAAAAVRANEIILKMTGFAEPEEDKQRPTTLVQVGQLVTSPIFAGLLAGKQPPKLNGQSNGAGAHQGATEEPGELSTGDRLRALVGKPPERD